MQARCRHDHVFLSGLPARNSSHSTAVFLGSLETHLTPSGRLAATPETASGSLAERSMANADQAHRLVVPVRRGVIMDQPRPDPGEEYPHVNTQLYGTALPAANRYQPVEHMVAPFNVPEPLPDRAPMNG